MAMTIFFYMPCITLIEFTFAFSLCLIHTVTHTYVRVRTMPVFILQKYFTTE